MRHLKFSRANIIIGTIATLTALVAIWNTSGIVAKPRTADFGAPPSIDVMQMMKAMRDLPEERYDAI